MYFDFKTASIANFADKYIFICGGRTSSGGYLAAVKRYDIKNNKWSMAPRL